MRDEELGNDNTEFLSNSNFIHEGYFELNPVNDKNLIFLTISSSFSSNFICKTPSKRGRILSIIDGSTTVSSIVKIESMLLFFKEKDKVLINRSTSLSSKILKRCERESTTMHILFCEREGILFSPFSLL